MARRKVEPPPVTRGLSTHAAISAIRVIEAALDNIEATAPRAVAAFGGRAAIQARFAGMAVGQIGTSLGFLAPAPRLTAEEWEQMSWEYVDGLTRHGVTNPGKGTQPNPRTGETLSAPPARGLGYGGAF